MTFRETNAAQWLVQKIIGFVENVLVTFPTAVKTTARNAKGRNSRRVEIIRW